MVDPQQFYLREGLSQEGFEISVKLIDKDKLEGDELLLCYSHDPAVSLTLKCSGWCDVSFVTDVEYNTAAFEALVLPAEKKEMIRSIMKQQERPSSPSFDDLIEGKGKGLIMLLHGPPGVGKTFTAVFLRTLEYFEGILSLVTNRVEVIDSARKQLCQIFILKAARGREPRWLDDKFLDSVSETAINGRQIKNTARVALALPTNREREALAKDMLITLGALTSFDMDLQEHVTRGTSAHESNGAIASVERPVWGRAVMPAERGSGRERRKTCSKSMAIK
ncbi:hypothetical protein DOTSEDRAFT_26035 [Dothistroma septosporum NZE10]|uniref:Uncharacterized protein n=1 Tax=Dothistroma septosporum (strain NZE10 / CBS 128990) TaxID=675120 RepID=N1PIK1_DOTSN|nr:hypothetical protein DOTSEDRAFT_26035 [Dothistroma septosporum NZE10]